MLTSTECVHADDGGTGGSQRLGAFGHLVLWLLLSLAATAAICDRRPPSALGTDAPLREFSAARAADQLAQFAQRPHPLGSPENQRVRDHLLQTLVQLGADAHIETGTGVFEIRPRYVLAGTVHNIVATLPGTANRRAVMLIAHYDSVPFGPGAGDDGAGVASILETLRALKAGPPLKNDVRVVFTDGEEAGLLGAAAYVSAHPELAQQAGVVMNFEGRGSSGAVAMFETSDANGGLIRQLAEAAPYPVASSLTYTLYKLLPNDTDMTVFKRAGVPGLNFAFTEGFQNYHTPLDTVAHLDSRTLQHMGSYALALTRHFGDSSFRNMRQADQVYFNWLGSRLVHYPLWMMWAVLASAGLLFVAVVVLGVARKQLRLRHLLLGCAAFLALLLGVTACIYGVWWLVQRGIGQRLLVADTASNELIVTALALAGIAAGVLVQRALLGRRGGISLSAGTLLVFGLLTAFVCIALPGGSYLLEWPLLAALFGLLLALLTRRAGMAALWLGLGAVPAVLLFAPMIPNMLVTFDLNAVSVLAIAILLGLLLTVAAPLLTYLSRGWRLAVPVLLVGALGCLAGGISLSRFSAAHPQRDTLYYSLDADHGKAAWVSYDTLPHPWTVQFLGSTTLPGRAADFTMAGAAPVLTHEAPPLPLAGPVMRVLSDARDSGVRTLTLHITSPRGADSLLLQLPAATRVLSVAWDGHPTPIQQDTKPVAPWRLAYAGLPADGVNLRLRVAGNAPVTCQLGDRSRGLPDLPGVRDQPSKRRALVYGDSVIVSRKCAL